MFLHAWSLKFNHPKSRKAVHLQAALPAELQQFLPARSAELMPAHTGLAVGTNHLHAGDSLNDAVDSHDGHPDGLD